MKIAIIGSGIAGLGCAHALAERLPAAQLALYEADARLGGHTHTVDISLDGERYPVDTGFLVFNERTYPNLITLFEKLAIPVAASDMSFGVSLPLRTGRGERTLEWAGSNLRTLFAQPRNLVDARFLSMLRDIVRFNRAATRIARRDAIEAAIPLGDYLDSENYGRPFRDWYLLPMAAAIWSCPTAAMLDYPLQTFVRFCDNHGLLQLTRRPRWYTVRGGARQYVNRIAGRLHDVRLADPVESVLRLAHGKVEVRSQNGVDLFDEVVLACHSDQAARILRDADAAERALLGSVRYQPNRALLHTDAALMPQQRSVWSAWNYLSDGAAAPRVSVSYWLNRLQPLPFRSNVFVSLNPLRAPAPQHTIAEIDYSHPVFDARAIAAQRTLPDLQGRNSVWFAGAWTGYGFHEDGLKSGLAVAHALAARSRREAAATAELRRAA